MAVESSESDIERLPELLQEAHALDPQSFLRAKDSIRNQTLASLNALYDYTKTQETPRSSKKTTPISSTEQALPKLITQGFDSAQIWEQLQLQNGLAYETLVSSISHLLLLSNLISKTTPQISRSESNSENEEEPSSGENEEDEDDQFVEPNESHHGDSNAKKSKSRSLEIENETQTLDTNLENTSKLSNFEKQSEKIDSNIKLIEKTTLQPKDWKYQGEITGEKRPENSLLEEHLLFDHLLKQAPEITAKTTLKLEDIIKNRIKDGAWDDVLRKAKPVDNPNEYKRALVMNQEKSKLSLAQIYEQEYIDSQRKTDEKATSSWSGGVEDSTKPPEDQVKMSKDLKSLFSKLDALSNFHYTPKLPSAEIKIVANIPSINMEEVAPISMSDATLLAPQEIQGPVPAEIKSKSERTTTDKLRERRVKKKKQHLKRLARDEKARNSGLGLRNIKIADNIVGKSRKNKSVKLDAGVEEKGMVGKELKSSKAFFNKLQNETQTLIKETLLGKRDTQKKKSSQLNAKRFKM